MNRFASGLAPHIQGLLEVKHALGLPYEESGRHLRKFDAMCARDFPRQGTLTREMAMAWVVGRPGEHVNGQIRRITPIRQLAKHMASMGAAAYVIPAGIPGPHVHYRPHIFSHQELRALFDAADAINASPFGGQRQLIIPVMFRMIYCLGLRPGEARKLHRNDVDLARGSVLIRESKGHKDRMVFLSPDLQEYCRHYEAAISTFHPGRIPFFPNHHGVFYSKGTPDYWFRELLTTVGPLITAGPGSPPRIYDLRHAHVIEVINRWVRAGRSPEALVAYLSLHLGHSNTEDTWYYFHLAADFHPELRGIANTTIETLFPEAHHEIR
ncbi:tyrosine-type recombinase/integrase [Arthrobacter sp. SDTb3-6]|uniref:tyrosine-type recombinase/integrase n=1 Tax=Arthrobacter sp. SDTb3-6 TaxID=2713571 RepID=UPI00159D33E4|nr:tyrosine-type recombinase/integrase [Arthrobacter sp. SDTb3-6]NVN00535.1 tyrosine-type recombinase/integrase [Arthrobacter sp. SDTb3-6]